LGGVPRAEIAAKVPLFAAHGFDPLDLFVECDAAYVDFRADIASKQALKPLIERNPGVTGKEAALRAQFEIWWRDHSGHITALAGSQSLVGLRQELLRSFSQSLETVGVLDAFQVRGIIAGFWNQTQYEFLTLMARGSKGVVDAWRTSIVTALEDKASKDSPLEHKLVKFLMGSFVEELAELEAKKAELDSQIKSATPNEDDESESNEAAETDDDNAVDEAQIKVWKQELGEVKKKLKAKKATFEAHLNQAVAGLNEEQAAELLLTILHDDMRAIVERYITQQRQQIIAAVENWWEVQGDADRDRTGAGCGGAGVAAVFGGVGICLIS
jgi:type I restriction enzyme M protein